MEMSALCADRQDFSWLVLVSRVAAAAESVAMFPASQRLPRNPGTSLPTLAASHQHLITTKHLLNPAPSKKSSKTHPADLPNQPQPSNQIPPASILLLATATTSPPHRHKTEANHDETSLTSSTARTPTSLRPKKTWNSQKSCAITKPPMASHHSLLNSEIRC